jgi:hypothetical protein
MLKRRENVKKMRIEEMSRKMSSGSTITYLCASRQDSLSRALLI